MGQVSKKHYRSGMGCNAWNHHPSCNCGWGGGNGAGWTNVTLKAGKKASSLFTVTQPVVCISVTTPNSCCPICGANVYFYESPYGGRVFFDELGPPWPKHPCTDNIPLRSTNTAINKPKHEIKTSDPAWFRFGWSNLSQCSVSAYSNHTVLKGFDANSGSTFEFGIGGVVRFAKDDPILVRRKDDGSGSWDISYLPINSKFLYIKPETITGFPGALTDRAVQHWLALSDEIAEADNMVGMILSFAQGKKADDGSWSFTNDPDWAAAELHFLIAACQGNWAGYHNLGAMYRFGFGVSQSNEMAFYLTLRALEQSGSESKQSLAALNDMFEQGWGSAADRQSAEELIAELQ